MVPTIPSASRRSRKKLVPSLPLLSSRLQRQISSVILLLSLICATVSGISQTKEQEKRGRTSSGSTQTPASAPPTATGVKPELILQTGHTRSVDAVVFSPDNRWLASGGKDNLIKIWDLSTGNILRTLYGHSSNIDALAVSPDGKLLASGSGDIGDKQDLEAFTKGGVVSGAEDNTVRIWSVQTGRQLQILRGHQLPIAALAFSNDGRSLTSVSGDAVNVWDVAAGTELHSLKTKYEKTGMEKFSVIASFGDFGSGNKERKQEMQRQINFKLSASRIAVSSNGQVAAVGQLDKAVALYDAQGGRELRELEFKAIPEAGNSSLALSEDARLVAFAKTTEMVSVQEAATGRELYSINTGSSKTQQRVQFSADGRFLVTATENDAGPAMKLWDAASGQLIRELKTRGDPLVNVRVINFNRDGSLIAVVESGAKTIRIIDSTTGLESRTLQTGTNDEMTRAERAAFLKTIDPKTTASLQKRDITTPEQIIEAVEAMSTISNKKLRAGSAVSFSADGRFLISSHVLLKNLTNEVWDTSAGTLVPANNDPALRERGKPFFSPDGRFRAAPYSSAKDLYSVGHNPFSTKGTSLKDLYKQKIDLYDGKSDKHLRELDGGKAQTTGNVPAAGFSFDGRLIALTGYENKARSVLVYETQNGHKVSGFPINDDDQSGAVTTLCLSADGHLLAAGYATKIDIFEVASGKTIRTLPHDGRIVSLSFNPDGRFLVALGENNEKYIWNASSGEKVATLVNLGGDLNSSSDWLVVTPDGLFDGSPAAWKQILWRFGGNTFDVAPAETFFNEFYYPGLLGEVIAGKKPRAPKNISQLDRRQPELRLLTQNGSEGAVAERNVTVKIEVTEKPSDKDHDNGSGARDVRLFRNGSLVKVWRGDVLKGQTSTTLETKITIVAGENRLTAYAFNRDNVKSKDAELSLTGADSLKRPGTAYILAIGVNAYSNTQYNLKYAVADATAFGEEVRRAQEQIAHYQHIEFVPLLDEQSTKVNILNALRRLAGTNEARLADEPAAFEKLKSTEPEDAVFVYYAGHGTAQGQRFYLLPHDLGYTGDRTSLDVAGLQTILEHGISDEELEQAVEGIDADKFLMVIDACNSGQALEAEERRRGPMNSRGLAQLAYEKGMYILTAAQSYQAAQEASQLGHGLLTYALIEEGLKQTAADNDPKDGLVWVREWFDYASTRVPNMQLEKMKLARGLGHNLSFVAGEERVPDSERLVTQTPRVFYRRESEARPLIVAKGSR
jgi:WD40 repeat protein